MITSAVFTLIKYGISSGAVSITELYSSETKTLCRLSGNLCSISCTQFQEVLSALPGNNKSESVNCIYKKIKHNHLTIGQIYFFNKTIISKQTEDRDFLYRVVVGKPLLDDTDDVIYKPLESVGRNLDYELDELLSSGKSTYRNSAKQIQNELSIDRLTLMEIHNEVTSILKKAFEPKINQSKEALIETLENTKAPDHVKFILSKLNEGVINPQHLGMNEYLQIIIDFIKNSPKNKFKQYEIISFLKYLILGFVPKDINDFPASKMTENQVNDLIFKTKELPDEHPYKWTTKRRLQVQNQESRYRKMVYVNDFLYLWKLYVINTTPIQEITEADIRVKFIVDMIIYKLSFEYSTERIILNQMEDVCIKRLKKILQTVIGLLHEYNLKCFSMYNIADLWLENQIKKQYMITTDKNRLEIEVKADKHGKRRANAQEIYEYLIENKLLEPVVLIE